MLEEKEELKAEGKKQKKTKKAKRDELRDAWNSKSNDSDDSEDDWKPDEDSDDEEDHYLPKSMLKKRKRAPVKKTWIFDLPFHRIILDEAHKIRNSDTNYYKSMMLIPAQRKLCLTGTPFVNRPSDIHSLLAFLDAEPLSDKTLFVSFVTKPIMEAKEIGLARIRTMVSRSCWLLRLCNLRHFFVALTYLIQMSHLALRRTKAVVESTIELVPKEVVLRHVEFPEEGFHTSTHDILYSTARAAFISLLRSAEAERDNSTVYRNFFAFLVLVLRCRQSCCSGYLVPEQARLMAEEVHQQMESGDIDLDAVEGTELLEKLMKAIKGQGNDEEAAVDEYDQSCAVCFEDLREENAVVLRSCKHVLCETCLTQISNSKCPCCRTKYSPDDMIKKTVAEAASKKKDSGKPKSTKAKVGENEGDEEDGEIHPKVQALLEAVSEMAPDEKGVVFSQWTSYLNVIQTALESNGYSTTRIDGSMNAFARIEAMEAFSAEDGPRIILCSLHACGTVSHWQQPRTRSTVSESVKSHIRVVPFRYIGHQSHSWQPHLYDGHLVERSCGESSKR
jgi:SNF2 family DNA or RNA helicase